VQVAGQCLGDACDLCVRLCIAPCSLLNVEEPAPLFARLSES